MTSYSIEGRDLSVVSSVQHQKLTILLIRFISAVIDLVTSGVDVNTLAISTSELILRAARELESQVVGLSLIAHCNKPTYVVTNFKHFHSYNHFQSASCFFPEQRSEN